MGAKEEAQEHTQDMSRRMQGDTFHVQQTSHTNVCNPAVRLKSMTLRCYELAELFASVMMEKKQVTAPFFFSLMSAHGAITALQHLTCTRLQRLRIFWLLTFLGL